MKKLSEYFNVFFFYRLAGMILLLSGWGWFIGDEGGGFYIGRKALQETAKLEDGRSAYNSDLNNKIKVYKLKFLKLFIV